MLVGYEDDRIYCFDDVYYEVLNNIYKMKQKTKTFNEITVYVRMNAGINTTPHIVYCIRYFCNQY